MSGETTVTVIGNLTAAPEPRFTSGSVVANFTIASTPRTFDQASNEWKDGETLFIRASVWGEAAKNAVASLTKGTRVVAHGVLKPRIFEGKDGARRTVHELEIEEIGVSLRYNPATPHRAERRPAPPAEAPVQRIPVDELPISPRPFNDDSAWFGKIANPSGNITPPPNAPHADGGVVRGRYADRRKP